MRKLRAFSLMEMMVVLLITAVVAAATAPMVSRKIVSSAGDESPWLWAGLQRSIVYNINGNDNKTAYIGGISSNTDPRLFINSSSAGKPQIRLFSSDTTPATNQFVDLKYWKRTIGITNKSTLNANDSVVIGYDADPSSATTAVVIGDSASVSGGTYGATAVGAYAKGKANGATAIGASATVEDGGTSAIAIGSSAKASATSSTAVGANATAKDIKTTAVGADANANGVRAIAIGQGSVASNAGAIALGTPGATTSGEVKTTASNSSSIAIGSGVTSSGMSSIAIGSKAEASDSSSIAIGPGAKATNGADVAIGVNAKTTKTGQIVLGTEDDTVYIPGRLIVGRTVYLNAESGYRTYIRTNKGYDLLWSTDAGHICVDVFNNDDLPEGYSDRRLKNVGEVFKGGLAEIKKLEVFNYTFKKDPDKTPRVGVMAQDLQKIFPKAVFKGEDGFLRIRMEDMFYAMVNAIKELDLKILNHDKKLEALEKQNAELEKRIAALEKRLEKQEKAK